VLDLQRRPVVVDHNERTRQRSSVVGATRNDRQREPGSKRLAAARKIRSAVVNWGRRV